MRDRTTEKKKRHDYNSMQYFMRGIYGTIISIGIYSFCVYFLKEMQPWVAVAPVAVISLYWFFKSIKSNFEE